MKWFSGVGIALLGIGATVAYVYHLGIGLGIFAVGVVLTAYGVRERTKEVTAKA